MLRAQAWSSIQGRFVVVHLLLGLGWIALILALNAPAKAGQIGVALLVAGWLPSLPVALLESRIRRLPRLLMADAMAAGLLMLLILTVYVPLFFTMVVWFLPLPLLPRGVLTELLLRGWDKATSTRPGAR